MNTGLPESSPSAGPRRPAAAHAPRRRRAVVDVAAGRVVDDVVDEDGDARGPAARHAASAARVDARARATARTTAAAAFASSGPSRSSGRVRRRSRLEARRRARAPTGTPASSRGPARGARSGARRGAGSAAPRGVFSVSAEARASGRGEARRSRDGLHGGILSSAGARGGFESPAGTSRGATDAGRDSSATRTSRAPRGLGCSVHRRAKGALGDCRITVTDGASSLAHRPCIGFRDDSDDSILYSPVCRSVYCTWYRHAFAFRCARFSRRRKLYRAGSRAPSFASAVHTRVTRRIQNGPNQAVSDPSARLPLFAGLGAASTRVAPGLPGAPASRAKARRRVF